MPQEPRSFFERLTGARVLNRGAEEQEQNLEIRHDEPMNFEEEEKEVREVFEEPEEEAEEDFSDEGQESSAEGDNQEGQLTVDVYHDNESVVIQSTVAGVSPDDLDVSITNDMVTIRGERRRQHDVNAQDYFYQECYWGSFSRSIILPVEIDADRAEAKIKNGILTIRIPKANAAVTRKLKVKAT